MIWYNAFLVLLREKILKKFKIKDTIFGSIGRIRVGYDPKISGFFGFESRKSYLEPKIFGQVHVGFSGRVNFLPVYSLLCLIVQWTLYILLISLWLIILLMKCHIYHLYLIFIWRSYKKLLLINGSDLS